MFKLPSVYTERVFLNTQTGFPFMTRIEDILWRNLTPPYLSNKAEVRHLDLTNLQGSGPPLLIMCSDGLMDLFDDTLVFDEMLERWVRVVGQAKDDADDNNLALCLLREALGGENLDKVSRMLTVEMIDRWMDDTTIIVHSL